MRSRGRTWGAGFEVQGNRQECAVVSAATGAVFECVHVATRAVVAVKLLLAIANEPVAEVESHAA